MSRRWLIHTLFLALFVSRVHAESAHTWVSSTGNDGNLCSRTSPCRTFVGAIAKTAMGGRVEALDAGDFGPINDDENGRPGIARSITIDGGAAQAAITFSTAAGVQIEITNPADTEKHVILRNLRIHGLRTDLATPAGISILGAKQVDLEGVVIEGSGGVGLDINVPSAIAVALRRCTILNNAGSGIASNAPSATEPVQLSVIDSLVAFNNAGIDLVQNASLVLSGSAVSANSGSGLVIAAGCAAHVDSSTLTLNALAAIDNSGAARISASEVTYNARAFRGGAAIETHGNNAVVENSGAGIGLPKPPVKVGLQ